MAPTLPTATSSGFTGFRLRKNFQISMAPIARGKADFCEGRSPQWMLEDPRTNLAISAWHILQLACGNFIALLNDLSNVMEVNRALLNFEWVTWCPPRRWARKTWS
jgi:hypothetical protein